jgi:hypothetical protein
MVDVGEGVLGVEWIEGKSVRNLLPGGSEEEGEDEEEEVEEVEVEDPLACYGVSQGTTTPYACKHLNYSLMTNRRLNELDRNRNRQNAPSRYHSR